MAVGFRTGGTLGATAASFTVSAANFDVTAGNYGFVAVITASATTISTSSSGWVQVGTTQNWASSGLSTALFYKKFTGAESGTILTVSFGASVGYAFIRETYSGIDPTSPINDYAFSTDSDTSSTSVPAPALTTTATSRVVAIGLSAGVTLTAPTGFISRNTTSTTGAVINWADKGPDDVAGSLGPWNFAITSTQHAAWSIALKEDPARREPAWEATSSGGNIGGGSFTPSLPAATQSNDLLLFHVVVSSSTATINTVPAGWSLIDSTFSGQCRMYTYRKLYDGALGSFDLDTAGINSRWFCSRYTSPNTSAPIGTTAENSGLAGTTVTFPALTPSGDGLLAYAGGSANTGSLTNAATTPTNATERYDAAGSQATGAQHGFGGTRGNASSGVATSTFTSTLTNSADWAAQTIVLASLPSPPAAPTGLTALVTQS